MSTTVRNVIRLQPNERHLSRLVLEHMSAGNVREHRMAVVCVDTDGALSVIPFEKETANTVYHERPLHMNADNTLTYEQVTD